MEDVLAMLAGMLDALRSSAAFQALTSYTAQRLYALSAIVVISLIGISRAYPGLQALHGLSDFEASKKTVRMPGPKPGTETGIERQQSVKTQRAGEHAWSVIGRIVQVFAFGVLIPFAAILLVSWRGDWFFPGLPVLVHAGDGTPLASPGLCELGVFALDLLLKGGLNDAAEVFEWSVGGIRHASSNTGYALLVLMFRAAADVFVLALLFYTARTFWNLHRARRFVARDAKKQRAGQPA